MGTFNCEECLDRTRVGNFASKVWLTFLERGSESWPLGKCQAHHSPKGQHAPSF